MLEFFYRSNRILSRFCSLILVIWKQSRDYFWIIVEYYIFNTESNTNISRQNLVISLIVPYKLPKCTNYSCCSARIIFRLYTPLAYIRNGGEEKVQQQDRDAIKAHIAWQRFDLTT